MLPAQREQKGARSKKNDDGEREINRKELDREGERERARTRTQSARLEISLPELGVDVLDEVLSVGKLELVLKEDAGNRAEKRFCAVLTDKPLHVALWNREPRDREPADVVVEQVGREVSGHCRVRVLSVACWQLRRDDGGHG